VQNVSVGREVRGREGRKGKGDREPQGLVYNPMFRPWVAPTFLWYIVSAIYCPPFGKVWLSFVCSVCKA